MNEGKPNNYVTMWVGGKPVGSSIKLYDPDAIVRLQTACKAETEKYQALLKPNYPLVVIKPPQQEKK